MLILVCGLVIAQKTDTLKLVSKNGLLFTTATVNQKEVYFIIDCGSAYSYLNESMGRKLGFDSRPVTGTIMGFGGKSELYHITSYTRVFFNEISIKNGVKKSVNLDGFTKILKVQVGGLLGNDFLTYYKARINFENRILVINN